MPATTKYKFRKMNGLGNEILVLDLRDAGEFRLSSRQAAAIASMGATQFDQLMALHPANTPDADAFVRIYNTDGSSAGACGNGMRCVALTDFERTGRRTLRYETTASLLTATVENAARISIDMGTPKFDWRDIPTRDPFHNTRRIELQIGPIDDPILHSPSVCSMGNPHAVFWIDDAFERYELAKLGPLLEHHPIFPEGANISLARVESAEKAVIQTWERGAGLTRACGSAACATLVCGVRLNFLNRQAEIIVPGGPLHVAWQPDDHVRMTGPAELENEGTLEFSDNGEVQLA